MTHKLTTEEMHRMTVEEFRESEKLPLTVVLDNVRSLNNIGSVFRTSDAFRVEHIALCGITATPPHREIHKTALGAEESVEWSYAEDTVECVRELKGRGYRVYAVEQVKDSVKLGGACLDTLLSQPQAAASSPNLGEQRNSKVLQQKPSGSSPKLGEVDARSADGGVCGLKVAIVLGNEIEGVQETVMELCDGALEIPQYGTKHSLNVSCAAAIVIWEISKQFRQ